MWHKQDEIVIASNPNLDTTCLLSLKFPVSEMLYIATCIFRLDICLLPVFFVLVYFSFRLHFAIN